MATVNPINIGSVPDDFTGDPHRVAFNKINENEASLNADLSLKQYRPLNRVVVNVLGDFPTPVAEVITLAANTEYYIGSPALSIGNNRFQTSAGTVISGALGASVLISTTTGDVFTGGDDGLLFLKGLVVSAASARAFNYVDTVQGTTLIVLKDSLFFCDSVGSFDNLSGVNMSNAQFDCTTTGASFLNTVDLLSFRQVSFNSSSITFKGIDLGSAISSVIELQDLAIQAPSGAFGISGLANNGNIPAGLAASITSCEFIGGVTPLQTITKDDVRWSFNGNSGIPDTMPDALASLTTNALQTTINTLGVAEKINGVWVAERSSHFTTTTDGRITYNGEKSLAVPMDVLVGLSSVTGTFDAFVSIAVNGVVVAPGIPVLLSSSKPAMALSIWQHDFQNGDYVEAFVTNKDGTQDIIAESGYLRIR